MNKQLRKTDLQEENEILAGNRLEEETVNQVNVYETHPDFFKVELEVEKNGVTEYYADSFERYTAIQILNSIDEGQSVTVRTEQDSKKVDITVNHIIGSKTYSLTEAEHNDDLSGELARELLSYENGVECAIEKINQLENGLVELTVSSEGNESYTFELSLSEYEELLDAKNTNTLDMETVYITKNRNAPRFAQFHTENDDGVFLVDSFDMNDYYPLSKLGITTFTLIASTVSILPYYLAYMFAGQFFTAISLLTIPFLITSALSIGIGLWTRYYESEQWIEL